MQKNLRSSIFFCTFADEMKKRVRNSINFTLGIMVAFLSGLFVQGLFAKCRPQVCKYGAPNPEKLEKMKKDSLEQKQDTVLLEPTIEPAPEPEPAPRPEPQPCKYGPPGGNW